MKKNVKNFGTSVNFTEGRKAALEFGRAIAEKKNASIAASHNEEKAELVKAGWSNDDIALHFAAQNAEYAANHGFIQPARSIRVNKPQYGPGMMFH